MFDLGIVFTFSDHCLHSRPGGTQKKEVICVPKTAIEAVIYPATKSWVPELHNKSINIDTEQKWWAYNTLADSIGETEPVGVAATPFDITELALIDEQEETEEYWCDLPFHKCGE